MAKQSWLHTISTDRSLSFGEVLAPLLPHIFNPLPAACFASCPFQLITEVEAASNPRRHFICSLVILFPLATSVSTHSFSVSFSPPNCYLSLLGHHLATVAALLLLGLVNEPKCVFVSHVSGLYFVALDGSSLLYSAFSHSTLPSPPPRLDPSARMAAKLCCPKYVLQSLF